MTHPSQATRLPLRKNLLLIVCTAGLTVGLYWVTLSHGFVAWDDDVNFLMNPYYRGFTAENVRWMFTSFHVGHYMPLTWLSAALDYELWGMDPRGYHLTSVLLHALCTVLLWRVIQRLLPDRKSRPYAAAIGALFFALHPLRVESVAWVTERRDVLAGVFLMLTVLTWLRSRESPGRRGWYAVSLLCFACSLLSKVSGMALPVALLVLDVFPLRGRPRLFEKLPFFALSLGGAVLGYLGQRESTDLLASIEGAPLVQRLAVSAYGLAFYVRKTALPLGLSPLYEIEANFDPLALPYVLSAAAVLALSAALWFARKRPLGAALLAAWIAYAVLAAPTLGLLQAGRQIVADRYSYVACMPFAVLYAAAALELAARWRRGLAAAFAVAILFGLLAHAQIAHWADSEALFRRVVAIQPESFLGHRKLGIALHEERRFDEALEQFERCLELRPERGNADAWTSLALSSMARGAPGDVDRTFEALDAALLDEPRDPLAWDVLENLLLRASRDAELEGRCNAALAADSENDRALLALARLQSARGSPEAALELCDRVLSFDPVNFGALELAGIQYAYLGRWDQAQGVLLLALTQRPRDPGVLTNLGLVVSRRGDTATAEALWRRALRYDPSHSPARRFLESPAER